MAPGVEANESRSPRDPNPRAGLSLSSRRPYRSGAPPSPALPIRSPLSFSSSLIHLSHQANDTRKARPPRRSANPGKEESQGPPSRAVKNEPVASKFSITIGLALPALEPRSVFADASPTGTSFRPRPASLILASLVYARRRDRSADPREVGPALFRLASCRSPRKRRDSGKGSPHARHVLEDRLKPV